MQLMIYGGLKKMVMKMNKHIKIGSRDSQLALWQTYHVIDALKEHFPDTTFEVVSMKTKGDKLLDISLSKIGDKGLFTSELESMMISGEIDLAVHSLKDMPTSLDSRLVLACFLKRYNHKDALLTKHTGGIMDLPHGAVVGTSSLRRRSQLLSMRPDLEVCDLRGNINTRLKKFHEGHYDAAILAVAGLDRLGFHDEISEELDEEFFMPAVGQGVLTIECRSDREDLLDMISTINHHDTYMCITAEREFMNSLNGGCQVPLGAYAQIIDDTIKIQGFVGSVDGTEIIKEEIIRPVSEFQSIGKLLADKLLSKGAKKILDAIR